MHPYVSSTPLPCSGPLDPQGPSPSSHLFIPFSLSSSATSCLLHPYTPDTPPPPTCPRTALSPFIASCLPPSTRTPDTLHSHTGLALPFHPSPPHPPRASVYPFYIPDAPLPSCSSPHVSPFLGSPPSPLIHFYSPLLTPLSTQHIPFSHHLLEPSPAPDTPSPHIPTDATPLPHP